MDGWRKGVVDGYMEGRSNDDGGRKGVIDGGRKGE